MARHLAPFPWRQMIAESVRCRSWGGVLPLGRQVSISGSSRAHCASVSMAPPRSGKAKRVRPQPVQGRTGRSSEQIISTLRQIEVQFAQEKSLAPAYKEAGISEQIQGRVPEAGNL